MKKILVVGIISLLSFNILAQEDWKIPKVNGKFQIEFNSKKIETGKKDLCEIYFGQKTQTDVMSKLTAAMVNGKVKFWSASNYTIFPTLYGADASSGNMNNYMNTMMHQCNPNLPDTLYGSLTINLTQVKVMSIRGGSVKVLFRIILKDNTYNIKFRGFEHSYMTAGTALKPGKMVVTDLEDEYNEETASKSDKKYWADIKMIIALFNSTLEEALASQASDFNFD